METISDRDRISTKNAPTPGNYSQGRVVDLGNHYVVHCAGQTGNNPEMEDEAIVDGGIGPQTVQALRNIEAVLAEVGGSLCDVVDMTVFMKDMATDKAAFEAAYTEVMKPPLPARALVEVSEIPLVAEDSVVELKATAYVRKRRPGGKPF